MPALLLAAMLAAAQQPVPTSSVVFARGHLDGWSMHATNVVDHRPSGPTINRMLCQMERDGVSVMTWRQGDVSFAFQGSVVSRGREHGLVRALVIDGVAYAVERRHRGTLTDRYTDVTYPDSQTVYPPSEFFSLVVRRQGSDLWLNAGNLNNELIEARHLRVGFGAAETGPLLWIEVPLSGLPAALSWCHAAMTSPNALRLRPR